MTKDDTMTRCKHCKKTWLNIHVQSSTSNLRKHLIQLHHPKLSDADKEYMTTGDTNTPKRALIKNYMDNAPPDPQV